MKYYVWGVIFTMLGNVSPLAGIDSDGGTQDWTKKRKEISLLRNALSCEGAYAFVIGDRTPRKAPHIHSQCWVDWLPEVEVERRAYEQEKREFGRDLVRQLDAYATQKIEIDNVVVLKERVRQLVAIAEWIKTSHGYGNYILKHQAEELALMTMAKMAVNDKCPVQEIRGFLGAIDTHAKSAYMQVAILNEESPHQYKLPDSVVGSNIQLELGRQWNVHRLNAKKYFMTRFPSKRHLLFGDVKNEERDYAFYIPDRNLGDASIGNYWNLKDHEEVCVYGMYSQKRDKIRWILDFREIIGEIPSPKIGELEDEASRERYVDKINDLWLAKGHPTTVKPIGRLVMWIYQGQFI